MNYTIVFKSGKVLRLIGINDIHMSDDWISFRTKEIHRKYTYPRIKIASVVFYP